MTGTSSSTGRMLPFRPTWKVLLAGILVLGAWATVVRFAQGLGASTHLSDAFPWGLWIGFDVMVGVGLAAGGFVIAATVHVFRIKGYEAIARPTILTAFLGYLLVIVALMFDLGRPYRIWHPLVMWNPHSVMFEIGWCVMLYTTVLALEFSPLVFERFGWDKALKRIGMIYVPLVIAGVVLSTLHQSSLGTLFVIAPDKLHGLWYSPLLPVFFVISAVAGGLAMTIFESFMSYRAFGKRIEAHLLRGMGRVIVVVLGLYAVIRLQDLIGRGALSLAWQPGPEAVMFWGEIGLGVLLPALLFAIPAVRRNEMGLLLASLLTIMGFVVNRLNVAVTGMVGSAGVSYVPSWMELAVTMAIVAVGFTLFGLAVKYLPIFPREELPALVSGDQERRRAMVTPVVGRGVLVTLWFLLLVGAVAVAWTRELPETERNETPLPPVQRTATLTHPDVYTFPPSEESPGPVTFRHETHLDSMGPDCTACHADAFSILDPGRPRAGDLTYQRIHEGNLCGSCHDGSTAFGVEAGCEGCHEM